MKYKVHRFDLKMTTDQYSLEKFLNNLAGEVVAIIPNVTLGYFWAHRVNFFTYCGESWMTRAKVE